MFIILLEVCFNRLCFTIMNVGKAYKVCLYYGLWDMEYLRFCSKLIKQDWMFLA